jgi:hypothetical protein
VTAIDPGPDHRHGSVTQRCGRRGLARAIGVCLIVSVARAAPGGSAPAGAEPPAALVRLIADAACTSDSQCRTMAVGTSACGGAERFLVWSTLRTEESALRAAAAAYPGDRPAAVRRGDRYSTCRPLADPGAHCERPPGVPDGQCVPGRSRHGTTAAPDR